MLKLYILKKVVTQCLSARYSNGDDHPGRSALFVPFCAYLEVVLWDVGECFNVILIGGTEFLGIYKLYFIHC